MEDRQLLSVAPNLAWATYLGGSSVDMAGDPVYGNSVAVDGAGNTLVAGTTSSAPPVDTGSLFVQKATDSYHGKGDAFVAKLSSDGSLLWVTYLGGSGGDQGYSIALDSAGNAFVTGQTNSTDFTGATNQIHGVPIQNPNGTYYQPADVFVAKVNGNDGSLAWATYLGGSGNDFEAAIAVDGAGNALVSATTQSSDFAGANNTFMGTTYDAVVAKVNGADGTQAWATYLGGSAGASSFGVAVDTGGNALVVGGTSSSDLAGANNQYHGNGYGSGDAFVAKVTSTGTLAWATYVGGNGSDSGMGIAVDSSGNAFATGITYSLDFQGATNSFDRNGNYSDAFVAKVTSAGSLAWATYLGGSGNDWTTAVAIDGAGNAFVTGSTGSTDFRGANNLYGGGTDDAFVAKVTGNGALAWASYLGGSGGMDDGTGVALDGSGNVVVAGYTNSTDFSGANNTYNGGTDAFVAKLNPTYSGVAGVSVSPTSGLVTTEAGGSTTFTIHLNTMPTGNVTIGLASSDTTEGTVSPASVTFTPNNWMSPQTVIVFGVDDAFYDGNVAYTIVTAKAISSDPNYSGLDPADVPVTNLDNEAPTTSTNWSGYAVATNVNSPKAGAVTDVKGSWTVPTASGSSTAYASFWIGIDGYSNSTVEQIGTDSDLSSSGKATYYAWYEMYPKGSVTISMTINPGDVMTAEVSYASNKFTLSITDTTTRKTYSTTQSAPSAQRSSAEWIAEAPSSRSGVLPLANFGTVYFTGAAATLNGHAGAINDPAWQSVPINMINSSGAVIAQTSVLPSDGKSFSVAWEGSGSSMAKGAAASARLTDAAMASYVLYQHPSQPDHSKDKPSSAISAVDLALLELGI